jgi:hypothetical protein
MAASLCHSLVPHIIFQLFLKAKFDLSLLIDIYSQQKNHPLFCTTFFLACCYQNNFLNLKLHTLLLKLLLGLPGSSEWIVLLLGLPLYFVPSIVGRKSPSFTSIFLLNLFTGWTMIGWIGSLIWALKTMNRRDETVN